MNNKFNLLSRGVTIESSIQDLNEQMDNTAQKIQCLENRLSSLVSRITVLSKVLGNLTHIDIQAVAENDLKKKHLKYNNGKP